MQRKRRPAKRAAAGPWRRRPASNAGEEIATLLRPGIAGPDPAEGLRLFRAFLKVDDPASRRQLIAQAEAMANKDEKP